MSELSEPSDPDLPAIERKIQSAYDHPCNRQNGCRDVRIDQLVQVMEQEPTLVPGCPSERSRWRGGRCRVGKAEVRGFCLR